jgi:UDP-N-acetylmuramoylalanine--D-glutamate ligase
MKDYRGKKVAVLGLARSGLAAAELLYKVGAEVYVSDTADTPTLRERAKYLRKFGIEVELGGHNGRLKDRFDALVLSPGVPTDIPVLLWYKSNRPEMPIISEIELAYHFTRGTIVGITGSNGKSTVVSMAGALFKAAGYETYVVGNIGKAVCEVVLEASEKSVLCVELSSFQLEMIDTFRPKVACLLNLTPDHLDRHYSTKGYYDAKARIFENQTCDDFAIVNTCDDSVMAFAKTIDSKVLSFGGDGESAGVFVRDGMIVSKSVDGYTTEIIPANGLRLPGAHNLANACAAIACTMPFGIEPADIARGFAGFEGLPHRLQEVGVLRSVRFINDSKATNVDSMECALKSFEGKVVLIAGGYDKGADFKPLRELVTEKARCVVLIGATAKKIESDWQGAVPMVHAASLEEAIDKAFLATEPEDVVLLAPGCASYDMFDNFEMRGEIFAELVKKLVKKKS